jgi:phosphonate transport system substrate-binding protein
MKKRIALLLASLMSVSMMFAGTTTAMAEESLTIQFVPTNSDIADATTEAFAEYIGNILDMDVTVTIATDYTTIVEAMESGQVDVGIMPPAAYSQARSLGAAESILSSTLVDYDENELPIEGSSTGTFKAEVLVAADSDIDSYEDLEGKNIAYLSVSSASGYIYPVAEMKAAGVDIDSCNMTAINDVTSAIKAVLNGQVDACFVFEGARYVFRDAITDDDGNTVDLFSELKVAKLSDGDIPNDAIAVLPSMSDETKEAVKEAFLQMASEDEGLEIMSAWGHTGYVESDEAAYDTIADYIEAAAE